ncbi:MAG: hypothetical protein SWK76_01410 [Actinomycetota bacterium]|nr:hypothetical protein [Actinomycetota bacterium]
MPGTLRLSHEANPYAKEPTNPLLAPGTAGSWDDTAVTALARRRDGGGYEVICRGRDSVLNRALGYADSSDGIAWAKYAGNPLIQGSGQPWDIMGVGTSPCLKERDTRRYWFSGYTTPVTRTFGYATSTDMFDWTRAIDF